MFLNDSLCLYLQIYYILLSNKTNIWIIYYRLNKEGYDYESNLSKQMFKYH